MTTQPEALTQTQLAQLVADAQEVITLTEQLAHGEISPRHLHALALSKPDMTVTLARGLIALHSALAASEQQRAALEHERDALRKEQAGLRESTRKYRTPTTSATRPAARWRRRRRSWKHS